MAVKLELYRVFKEVAETGNISAAAKNLYISQSAVSQSIKQLETALQARLFARSPRGVTLTGEGQMFADGKLRGAQIPFYNVDVEQAIAHVTHLEAESSLVIPQAGECDLAMCYMGRAMGDALPPGAVVLLKAVDRDAIIPGGEYVIVSRKIVTLRIVRLADGEDKLRLVAGDRENYDDIILNVSDISSVYKVKGKLIINS